MTTRILTLLIALTLVTVLGACASSAPPDDVDGAPSAGDGAAGLRLAPGLYDQGDGTVLAIGTLEYSDLEGGFYVIVGGTEGEGNLGETVAVVNNASEWTDELESLLGKTVSATGTGFDGVSTRMAGPEIILDSIEEISDTPGIAE